MCWLKSDRWKVGIALVGVLLFLVLMVWVPVSEAGGYEGVSGLAIPGTVQATPTEDATITALNKEKLAQEVQQLKNQNATDLFGWLRTNAAVLLSTLVVVIGGLIGLFRWLGDRRDEQEKRREDQRSEQEKRAEEQKRWLEDRQAERERRDEEQQRWLKDQEAEREKRAEERFQSAVTGLGDDKEGAKVGAAILLRTFLRPGYEQFYSQTFDLAVANLRLRHLDPATPEPLTSLSQALVIVFKESFPLARKRPKQSPQFLDASCIQLDNAHLAEADLREMWLPEASLRNAALRRIDLSSASLYKANLFHADLEEAILTKTNLYEANLVNTDLSEANLTQADLRGADLSGANLWGANLWAALLGSANLSEANLNETNFCFAHLGRTTLKEADLRGADLRGADLRGADLRGADLRGADLRGADQGEDYPGGFIPILLEKADFRGADFRGAKFDRTSLSFLKDTDLRGIKGLTKEQLEACKAKGAIVDEDITASSPQATISPSSLSQSIGTQAQSAPPTQSIPTPDTDGSIATSSKPDSES